MSPLVRAVFFGIFVVLGSVSGLTPGNAAPYAAMVIDARTGEVLHSRNADARLHPASLTKMMTLYVAFEALRLGEISLDTRVRISPKAANEPPSRLGLRAGQRIEFRYLIRAAAVKSANDAATAIAEAISGTEAAFARRMTRTAKALGMTRTTFKNAHGLTERGHLSTARDMTNLGRHLFFDYPQYYNLFSRQSTNAGLRTVRNTNRKLLASYRGADGIKTGYTSAAGFNLVASAERGSERIIATVFGGRSAATRNARVAELLDMGFQRAPTRAAVRPPSMPAYNADRATPARQVGAVTKSIRPSPRPIRAPDPEILLAVEQGVENVVEEARETLAQSEALDVADAVETALAAAADLGDVETPPATPPDQEVAELELLPEAEPEQFPEVHPTPSAPPRRFVVTALDEPEPRIVTRSSQSGPPVWSVRIGGYTNRYQAERVLIKVALKEMAILSTASRQVERRSGGFQAVFSGISEARAQSACQRLAAQNVPCEAASSG